MSVFRLVNIVTVTDKHGIETKRLIHFGRPYRTEGHARQARTLMRKPELKIEEYKFVRIIDEGSSDFEYVITNA
jgi:hypothetical protein